MHLAINATEVGRRRGGNESYVIGLVDGLAALPTPPQVSLLTCRETAQLRLPSSSFHEVDLGPYRRMRSFLWQQTRALRTLAADWYLANFFLPPALPCRGAVVVHDLSFRAHPEYFPAFVAWYMYWVTLWSIRRARLVVTVSDFSRQEIQRYCSVDDDKLVMIPNGIGREFQPAAGDALAAADRAALARYRVNQPYILALGNIHPRKNLARLLDAYILLRQEHPDAPQMVWGGSSHWGSARLLERARAAGVVVAGFIAQEDLPALYRQATMLVYPSLYEGFGLPPLEAMACGTPVATSRAASLPEVVGGAALLFDPLDVRDMVATLGRLMADRAERERLRDAGLAYAQRFDWTQTAQRLVTELEARS